MTAWKFFKKLCLNQELLLLRDCGLSNKGEAQRVKFILVKIPKAALELLMLDKKNPWRLCFKAMLG